MNKINFPDTTVADRLQMILDCMADLWADNGIQCSFSADVSASDFLQTANVTRLSARADEINEKVIVEDSQRMLRRVASQSLNVRKSNTALPFSDDYKSMSFSVTTKKVTVEPLLTASKVTDETPEQGEGEFILTISERIKIDVPANQTNQ